MLAPAMNGPPRFCAGVALALGFILAGCGSASVSAARAVGATPGVAPPTVYVRDFDLDAATIKVERGVLPAPRPFYELDTTAASGPLPGAVITLNPYVAAVRFVLAGHDLEGNVKQTADQIAADVAARAAAAK
jgi:hypothetical protein